MYQRNGSCPFCGSDMLGDGYSTAIHCENAEEERYAYNEPDSNPVYCCYILDPSGEEWG
jgi:hypothetical protein